MPYLFETIPSVPAVPFGSFEEVLSLPENADVRRQIEDAAQMVGQDPAAWLKQVRGWDGVVT